MPHFSPRLRFVESEDTYSVYVDPDGNEVFLQHGTAVRLVEFDSLDLQAIKTQHWSVSTFLDALAEMVIDPERVDDIVFCDDCSNPDDGGDDFVTVKGGDTVCQDCFVHSYWMCDHCEEYDTETSSTLHDSQVCQGCLDWYYSWCDDCDGYYSHDDSHEHEHSGCDCEAPAQKFSVRNDGMGPLANDTRTNVSLPAGEISDEGVGAVARLIRDHARTLLTANDQDAANEERRKWWELSYRLGEVGTTWQTGAGNYTKRLSRFAYKEYGLKVPPAMLSEVGNIGRAHSGGVDFAIEVTRNLNLPAYEFAHEDSCWWQSYSESRCALKNNGGYGLRSFGLYGVSGRAWVMPLKKDAFGDLTPTFNTETPDAFVVFNGYGDLSGYTPARIVAHMAGMTYRKIEFCASPMYVNGESGYLVASEDIAKNYTDGSLDLYLSEHASLYTQEQRAADLVNA